MNNNDQRHSTALIYDFDGTLAPGNIQEHSLVPNHLGTNKEEFWQVVGERKRQLDADQILVYLQLLVERARDLSSAIDAAGIATARGIGSHV